MPMIFFDLTRNFRQVPKASAPLVRHFLRHRPVHASIQRCPDHG